MPTPRSMQGHEEVRDLIQDAVEVLSSATTR